MTDDHLFSLQPAWPSTAVSSLLSAFVVLVLGLALSWALCRLDPGSAAAAPDPKPATAASTPQHPAAAR